MVSGAPPSFLGPVVVTVTSIVQTGFFACTWMALSCLASLDGQDRGLFTRVPGVAAAAEAVASYLDDLSVCLDEIANADRGQIPAPRQPRRYLRAVVPF